MFSKQTLLATLMGGITLYFLGWIFYDLVAGDYYEENAVHQIPVRMDMISIALGALIQAFVLSNLYRHWAAGKTSHFQGFAFGAWIGLFVGLGTGLIFYGTAEVHPLNTHLVDAVWKVMYYGITGHIIAWGFSLLTPPTAADS